MKRIQIVRHNELIACRTAFIDTHTPGSDQKENFTIIGGGVSESHDQHVHIKETPGFNIGAAGQPPGCTNSLHTHRTAEVFFVLNGRWRFFWGRYGNAGEVVLEKGDIFNIPTGIFRGFENIGNDYAMIMAILGGNDAGGGVIWTPEVIQTAKQHGLILGENGVLYDRKKGEYPPADVNEMPALTATELQQFAEPTAAEVVPYYVKRYWDLVALGQHSPTHVIGDNGLIKDRPGFEVDFLTTHSIAATPYQSKRYQVLMPLCGGWQLKWADNETTLNAGDSCLIKPNTLLSLSALPDESTLSEGQSALFRIRNTDDPAGATRQLS